MAKTQIEALEMARDNIQWYIDNLPDEPDVPEGWQPIETAPKDCRILIGREGHPWVYSGFWSDRSRHWSTGYGAMDYFDSPTHWMPLPAAPKKED